jgi:hypothetical protein
MTQKSKSRFPEWISPRDNKLEAFLYNLIQRHADEMVAKGKDVSHEALFDRIQKDPAYRHDEDFRAFLREHCVKLLIEIQWERLMDPRALTGRRDA